MLSRALRGSVCLALLLFSAWPANLAAQTRREVRVGVPAIPPTLDPSTALEGAVPLIARQVFETLVVYREGTTDIEPGLATRWSVSRDGLTWSFVVRENVRFHDGSPLTTVDVAESFNRQLAGDTGASGAVIRTVWSALLRGTPGVVKTVRAADAHTVQIVLAQPYAPLLTVLAHPGFGVVKSTTADGVSRLIGTGPYRMVDIASGRIALEAQAGHWSGGPRAERLVFYEVASDQQAEAEFDAGALDAWFPPDVPRRTEGALSIPGVRIGYLAFQTEKEPFAKRKIRQAVAAAVDPAALGVALGPAAVPLQSFLPPGVWARREGSPILTGNRDAVRKLLAEGGWPRGFKPTLLVQTDSRTPSLQPAAETLALNLAAADIPVRLRLEPPSATRAVLQAGEYDMALAEAAVAGGDPHLFLFPLSTTEGASKGPRLQNFSFYRNPRVDDLLIRGSQLAYRIERYKLYQRAQAMLAEDLPWVPIYVRLEWAVVRSELRGLRLHPTGFHRLDTVFLDPGSG
jgi:peptide/nickel transport system substrate-binding protein